MTFFASQQDAWSFVRYVGIPAVAVRFGSVRSRLAPDEPSHPARGSEADKADFVEAA